jgi:hypothetical protein
MITDTTEELKRLIKRKEELNRYKDKRDEFVKRRKDLSEKVEALSPLVSCGGILGTNFHASVGLISAATLTAKQTEALTEEFKKVPESILRPPNLNFKTEYLANIQAARNALEAELTSAWRRYTESRLPEINANLLQALFKIPAFKPVISKLNRLLTEVTSLAAQLPVKQDHFDEFNQKAAEIDSTWQGLVSGDVPEEVLTFLQQVGTALGAPLGLLTNVVSDWLLRHNIYDEFRITIRRAGPV